MCPVVHLSLAEQPFYNIDDIAIGLNTSSMINCYIDTVGARLYSDTINKNDTRISIKRPGIITHCDLTTCKDDAGNLILAIDSDTGKPVSQPVDGCFWWKETQCLILVTGNVVIKVTKDDTDTSHYANLGSADLLMGNKVRFVNYFYPTDQKNYLFFAAGSRINYIASDAITVSQIADPNAPVNVDFVNVIDSMIIANDNVNHVFRWAEPIEPFTWRADSSIRPDSIGDTLRAVIVLERQILLIGTKITEFWYPTADPMFPFQRYEGSTQQYGVTEVDTIVTVDKTAIWLDSYRRVIACSGGQITQISHDIDKLFQSYSSPLNAFANSVYITGRWFYLLSFQGSNVTWVYDQYAQCWYNWANWDANNANYNMFVMKNFTYCDDWNLILGGSFNEPTVSQFSVNIFDDDGSPIRMVVRTGRIDHGTVQRKRSDQLWIRTKKGFIDIRTGRVMGEDGQYLTDDNGNFIIPQMSADEIEMNATLYMRWRDDGDNTFGRNHTIKLAQHGKTKNMDRLNRLGMYRNRQYEFVYSGATPFILIGAEEEINPIMR